jgi:cell division protein FtsZ
MGKAMMGTGEATGEDRALMAAQNAIQNPLLDEVSLKGAKAVLVNVTGGLDMTLLEVDEAANAISEQVDPEANIIFGAAFDPSLEGMIRVSVVATGMDGASMAAIEPKIERRSLNVEPLRATVTPRVPELEPVMAAAATEHELAMDAREEEQPDIFSVPLTVDAEPVEAAVEQVAETVDLAPSQPRNVLDEPLFAEPAYEPRRPRGGFLSIFGGRPRYEAPAAPAAQAPAARTAPAPSRGGAQPMEATSPAEATDQNEDLEIPSFLRRLAN